MRNSMVKAILKPVGSNSYRHNDSMEGGVITGVHFVTPNGLPSRYCYEVTYNDGFVDYVPMSSVKFGDWTLEYRN